MTNKSRRTARLSSAALALALILAAPAGAQTTREVDSWAGFNQAWNEAEDGDTLSFGPGPAGAVTAGAAMTTDQTGLTLDGQGWVLDLNRHGLIFEDGLKSLTGLRLTGGWNASDGGAVSVTGDLNARLVDSAFVGNSSAGIGGALYVSGGLNGSLVDSVFVGNSSVSSGGAVYVGDDISGGIDGAVFAGNHSDGGGAVCAGGLAGLITGSTFVNNSVVGQGGALWFNSSLRLGAEPGRNTLFAGNTDSSGPNSILLKLTDSGSLDVNPGAGGVVDMRDPFTIIADGDGTGPG